VFVSKRSQERHASPSQPTRFAANQGYGREKIHFAAVIGVRGQLIAFEKLQTDFTRKCERLMTVPQIAGAPYSTPTNFLWDKTGPALGIRRKKGAQGAPCIDEIAFERFKAFHRSVLAGVSDLGVEAFLRFLETWSPEEVQDRPEFQDKLGCKIVFRFQYDDGFLHDRGAARAAWNQVLEETFAMKASA
jgi:CRISPR-associated protein Csd1